MGDENWQRHWKEIYDGEFRKDGANGFLQWKGTDACIDLHCKCGQHDHLDADFIYYWECSKCKTLYALNPRIELKELDEWNSNYIRADRGNVIKKTSPEDEL